LHSVVSRKPGELSLVQGELVQQLRKQYQKRAGWCVGAPV
jgi:hypothetical protein